MGEMVMAGALLFVACVMAGAVLGGFIAWRYGRRKLRAFRSHGLVLGAMALWDATSSGRLRPRPPTATDEVHQWTSRRVRREMWRAVDQADAAVRAANEGGAPNAS